MTSTPSIKSDRLEKILYSLDKQSSYLEFILSTLDNQIATLQEHRKQIIAFGTSWGNQTLAAETDEKI